MAVILASLDKRDTQVFIFSTLLCKLGGKYPGLFHSKKDGKMVEKSRHL
jgi:hypothetical protein